MNSDDFKTDLTSLELSFVTSRWILENQPTLFKDSSQHIIWKQKLADLLKVDSKNVLIVGSAALGFSLNPSKNFKQFGINSDIDVAIISNYFFNTAWREIRTLGSKRYNLTYNQQQILDDHRQRLIFWGTVATDRILSIFSFGKSWIKASNAMKETPPTEGRDINYRLYMNFDSLRAYHSYNIKRIKNNILSPTGGESELS